MNYSDKISKRNQFLSNIRNNPYNPKTSNITQQQWYKQYMPFLPNDLLEYIPQLEKEIKQIKRQEETLEDLKYTFIKEEPYMVLADLISNIGGILGVFIGYSIISFMEIIELLIAIFFPIKKKKENQNEDNEERSIPLVDQ